MIIGYSGQNSDTSYALDWPAITVQVSKIHKTNIKKDVIQ